MERRFSCFQRWQIFSIFAYSQDATSLLGLGDATSTQSKPTASTYSSTKLWNYIIYRVYVKHQYYYLHSIRRLLSPPGVLSAVKSGHILVPSGCHNGSTPELRKTPHTSALDKNTSTCSLRSIVQDPELRMKSSCDCNVIMWIAYDLSKPIRRELRSPTANRKPWQIRLHMRFCAISNKDALSFRVDNQHAVEVWRLTK